MFLHERQKEEMSASEHFCTVSEQVAGVRKRNKAVGGGRRKDPEPAGTNRKKN